MKLDKVKLYNFRFFSEEQTIQFDDLTTIMYIPFQVNHLHGQTEPVPRGEDHQ